MIEEVWWLLIAYQVKHFLCDYPLQNEYMLGKFKPGFRFIVPLASHSGVHLIGTLMISFCYLYHKGVLRINDVLLLSFFDFTVHFSMDRIKASPNFLGRFKALSGKEFLGLMGDKGPSAVKARRHNTYFWWSLGADQTIHHITHYCIIFYMLSIVHY